MTHGLPFLLQPKVLALQSRASEDDGFCKLLSNEWVKNRSGGRPERIALQVKGINNIPVRIIVCLLVAMVLHTKPSTVARGAEPALPKLNTEAQEAVDR